MYSLTLLKLMGINLSKYLLQQEVPREVKMWRAVITLAFEDVASNSVAKVDAYRKQEAHTWLLGKTDDFKQVCYYAEIEPEFVIDRYQWLRDQGSVKFTRIQRLWLEYKACYKVYRGQVTKDQRQRIMARIRWIKDKITELKKQ